MKRIRYFDGRYFVPYDKGGASDIEEGWLPNYYVPTPFFIDWSEEAVRYLLEGKLIREQSKKPFPRNIRYYFKEGITFSVTGIYAPMYKISTRVPFDHKASCIFSNFDKYDLLGILNSKFFRYILKSFMVHTVEASEGAQKNFPYNRECNFKNVVISIIKNQKQNPHYDYMTNEQLEIDKLVYELYNLNEEDIKEVENWYFRRYPKLAKAIEEKLKVKNND